MSLKETIEKDLKAGKSLDDSLLENNKSIEDLILEILKENREIHKRIEESERSQIRIYPHQANPKNIF